jgi:hypothetical protein
MSCRFRSDYNIFRHDALPLYECLVSGTIRLMEPELLIPKEDSVESVCHQRKMTCFLYVYLFISAISRMTIEIFYWVATGTLLKTELVRIKQFGSHPPKYSTSEGIQTRRMIGNNVRHNCSKHEICDICPMGFADQWIVLLPQVTMAQYLVKTTPFKISVHNVS